MEKEKYFLNSGNLPSLNFGVSSSSPPTMDVQIGELNDQLPNCYLNLNWENSMDQSVPFESALSSIVSSPVASNSSVPAAESVVIRELIGRLGSICNSGEISPQSHNLGGNNNSYMNGNNSTNTSCYSTPLNSPPKLNLSIMDHQLRGNLSIQGNSMQTHHPTLAPFPSDPGFAERAARLSCFGTKNFGGLSTQFGLNEPELPYRSNPRVENEKLSRVSSSQSLKATGSQMGNQEIKDFQLQDMLDTEMRSISTSDRRFSRLSRSTTPEKIGEFNNAQEDSSISEQIPTGGNGLKVTTNDVNGRKRKAVPRGKAKDLPSFPSTKDIKTKEEDDSNVKRSKPIDENGSVKAKAESTNTAGEGSQKNGKENQKLPEPPKDYIHVRARRGQATDSHSLAERVRREKISERMKFLQDLVPGCNKVTGKAVMLDEIINYVQSLQRQVEFLSMKLSTVNPRLDFNMETLLSKDILQSRGSFSHPSIYPIDSSSASAFTYGHQHGPYLQQNGITNENHCSSVNPLDAALRRNLGLQLPPLDGFCESASQLGQFWEDDLQSVVHMGFGQNQGQETGFQSQNSHGLPSTHMKVEL